MLKLCGFAASNYYNTVKLALLEKQLPFEEALVWAGHTDTQASPLGKVPYLLADAGALCESTVILEYIEALHPQPALLPADLFAAAKVRELMRFIELHLELVARNLYPEAFFGSEVSDSVKEKTSLQLIKHIGGFAKLARFAPFVAGDTFTLADCAAIAHLPLISSATKAIYGRDYLAHLPVRDYLQGIADRPSVQKVNADRKANLEQMMTTRRKGQDSLESVKLP